MVALTRFIGSGLALRVRARSQGTGVLDSLKGVSFGGGSSGGGGEGTVPIVAAAPEVGVAGGGRLSSASLLLLSLGLALLARSRLLLPE